MDFKNLEKNAGIHYNNNNNIEKGKRVYIHCFRCWSAIKAFLFNSQRSPMKLQEEKML